MATVSATIVGAVLGTVVARRTAATQPIHGGSDELRASSSNVVSFGRDCQRHRPQVDHQSPPPHPIAITQFSHTDSSKKRSLRCVAEDAPAVPPAAPPATAKPTLKPTPKADASPKKPTFTMSKGQIVRVDKEKYLNSIEYYALGHPKFFKGIDYIYEDRGEILDLRNFEAGEYALIVWAGIPTAPAWLPTYMLTKSDKLSYKRA